MKDQPFYENLFDIVQEFHGPYTWHRMPYSHDLLSGFNIKALSYEDISSMNFLYKQESLQISKLAENMVFKLPNMNRLLNKLENLGITERFSKEDGRNARYVRLTSSAQDRFQKIVDGYLARYKIKLEESLTQREFIEASDTLSFLLDAYEKVKVLTVRPPAGHFAAPHEAFWDNVNCYRFYNNYFFADPPYKKPALLQKANLSYNQMFSLVFLIKMGKPVSMASFAEERKILPYQATRLFDKLEKSRFVRRFKRDGEHRTVYVEPTDIGTEVVASANDMYHAWLSKAFNAALTDTELDRIVQNYKFLIKIFKKLCSKDQPAA